MRAGKSRAIFATAFALALIAGIAAGILATRYSLSQAAAGPAVIPTLDDLQLTPNQRDQIQKIWEGVKNASDDSYKTATRLQHQLDQKTLDLLTPEQKERYAVFHNEYQQEYLKLQAARDEAVKKAIDETKTLLSNDQRQKYDAILRSRLGHANEPVPSMGPSVELPNASAATRPAGSEL
jgi:Spy/CpxP family protein refolding chaperone